MAATAAGSALTEAHRLAQLQLGARTVAQMSAAWGLVDISQLDQTALQWMAAVSPIIGSQRVASANLAANYLRAFRVNEIGIGVSAFTPVLAGRLPAELLTTSLRVTGPVKVKQALARGLDARSALALGQAASSRAGMRHVMNGGRDTITRTIDADPKAIGWIRVTSGKACAFCAMLSSRGPVYKSEGTAKFKSHDGCSCSAEPTYSRDAPWTPSAQHNHELWTRAKTQAEPGEDIFNVFRRELAHN